MRPLTERWRVRTRRGRRRADGHVQPVQASGLCETATRLLGGTLQSEYGARQQSSHRARAHGRCESRRVDDCQKTRLTEAKLHALSDRLFPHGFAAAAVFESVDELLGVPTCGHRIKNATARCRGPRVSSPNGRHKRTREEAPARSSSDCDHARVSSGVRTRST
jgi:hypothetical protein